MNKRPLVTIVTPVYNAEKYIRDCIESVLNQTYTNWEMILVDDCSTDHSISIIKEYLSVDNRIKLFENQKNSGPAVSRNLALSHARGQYITFLDSDDMILEDKLKKQVNFMIKNKLYFTHGNYSFCDDSGKIIKSILTSKDIDYKTLLKGNQFKIMTVMIDTKILKDHFFLEIKHEDYQFFLNILKRGFSSKVYSKDKDSLCRININTSVSSNKIKSAIWTWLIYYKYENLGLIKSIYYFIRYAINGIIKYKVK